MGRMTRSGPIWDCTGNEWDTLIHAIRTYLRDHDMTQVEFVALSGTSSVHRILSGAALGMSEATRDKLKAAIASPPSPKQAVSPTPDRRPNRKRPAVGRPASDPPDTDLHALVIAQSQTNTLLTELIALTQALVAAVSGSPLPPTLPVMVPAAVPAPKPKRSYNRRSVPGSEPLRSLSPREAVTIPVTETRPIRAINALPQRAVEMTPPTAAPDPIPEPVFGPDGKETVVSIVRRNGFFQRH